jgi:acyl carrier protein
MVVFNGQGVFTVDEAAVLTHITGILSDIARSKGLPPFNLESNTELLGGGIGIDSLDLATLVTRLERATGRDPFADGFIDFRTAGELARLYAR